MREKNKSFGIITRLIAGFVTLVSILVLVPCFANRALAKENGVALEGTGTLLLFGHFTKDEVREYAGNEAVIKVEAMDGAVFPEDCRELFRDFYYTEYFDLSLADTSNVKNMNSMFYECNKAKRINVQGFDTSNVINMYCLFSDCYRLEEIDVSSFDTSKVYSMSYMFNRCNTLKELDLSNFDTSKVSNMAGMFWDCVNLERLDVSSFDTRYVDDFSSMFQNCVKLTSLNLSNFDTSKANNMTSMFSGCNALKTLNVSGFDTSNVTEMKYMFYQCSNLTELDLIRFDTSRVSTMQGMFSGCRRLKKLDLSSFDVSNVKKMSGMFWNTDNLETIYASNRWNVNQVYASDEIFKKCGKLVGGNGTKFDANKVNKNYARIDKSGQPGYFTEKKIPQFTLDLESHYDFAMDSQVTFVVNTDEAAGQYAYKWFVYDKYGKKYSILEAVNFGWLYPENLLEHYDERNFLRVAQLTSSMDGKKIACFVTGKNNVTVRSTMAEIHVTNEIARFEYTVANLDKLNTIYKSDQIYGRDLKKWKVSAPKNAKYSVGSVRWGVYLGSWKEMDDNYDLYPGDKIQVGITIQPKDGYSVYDHFGGTINGQEAQVIKLTDGSRMLVLEMEIPIPDYGILIPSFNRKIATPVAGDEPATSLVSLRPGQDRILKYDVEKISWYPADKKFVAGKDYTVTIELKAYDNYGFYEGETEFYLNDQKMKVEDMWMGKGGTAKVSCKFHVSSTEPIDIVKQPENWFGSYGKKASFDVVAEGNGLTYQWQYKKGSTWYNYEIATADTPNFRVTFNEKNEKWAIKCVITDADGHTKDTVEVHMINKDAEETEIVITSQPVDWYGNYGKKASFDVTATGTGLTYQWQYKKSGTWYDYELETADTPNFKVTFNEKNEKWPIRCLITDAYGKTKTTNEVWMKLKDANGGEQGGQISINTQPVDWYGQYGKKASFNVSATGNGISYQWQYLKGGVWNNYEIATANTANFKVTMNEKNVKWAIRCLITDADGNSLPTNEVRLRLSAE